MKKIVLFLLAFTFLLTSVSAYEYNENYTNLTITKVGWCSDISILFKIYNQTEYDLHKMDDNYNFTNISSLPVQIHSGPLQSMPLILNSTASSNAEFTYTFTSPNNYLLEILPAGNYNDYHELISIEDCKYSKPELITNETYLFDKVFIYSDIKITVNRTDMQSEKDFTIKNINGLESNGLAGLPSVIKSFSINGINKNYSNIDMEVALSLADSNFMIKGYHYENNQWIEKPILLTENKVLFKNISYGVYAISSEPKIITSPSVDDITNQNSDITGDDVASSNDLNIDSQDTTSQENIITDDTSFDTNTDSTTQDENTSKSSSSNAVYIIGFIILLIIIAGVFIFFGNKKSQEIAPPQVEVLNTYTQTYNHVKTYVQTYKIDYGKDQIYRALETVGVPRDIIDKVFLEEFK